MGTRRSTKILIAIGSAVDVLLILAVIGVVVAVCSPTGFAATSRTIQTSPNARVRVLATNRMHMFQEIAALQFLSGQQPSLANRVLVKPSILYALYNRHSENSR